MPNPFRWLFRKLTLVVFNYIHTRSVVQRIQVLGRPFDVYLQVYNPGFSKFLHFPTTEHLAKFITLKKGESVLDMGTGIGVQAVIAALKGGDVTATDIFPTSVACTKHNAKLNNVNTKIDVRCGDLFKPIAGEHFDLIIWLPPSFFSNPVYLYQSGWMCGVKGEVLQRFCEEADSYLNKGGRILFSCVDRNRTFILEHLKKNAFHCRLIAPPKRRFPLETITIYEARRMKDKTNHFI